MILICIVLLQILNHYSSLLINHPKKNKNYGHTEHASYWQNKMVEACNSFRYWIIGYVPDFLLPV